MEAKKRRSELSLLNVLFCLLVMLIHCMSGAIGAVSREPSVASALIYLPWRLAAFVVPGFIFLSGVKLTLGGKARAWGGYYLGRIKSVVLPYVAWVVIYFVYFYAIGYVGHKGAANDARELLHYILVGDLSSHFYFVIVIVQFYALAPIFTSLVKKIHPTIFVGGSAAIMLLFRFALPDMLKTIVPGFDFAYNDRVFTTYLLYFSFGAAVGAKWEDFCEIILKSKWAITALFALFTLIGGAAGYLNFTGIFYYSWLEIAHMCYTVFAILFCLLIALLIKGRVGKWRIISMIDRSSYAVYLYHCLILNITARILDRLGIVRIAPTLLVKFAAVFGISLGIAVLWTAAKGKIKGILKK